MEKQVELTEEQAQKLYTKEGLMYLLQQEGEIDLKKAVRFVEYESELDALQEELIKLQNWVIEQKKKIIILFEGRDSAGKGGAIRRFTEFINPRFFKIIALPKPIEEEKGQWYFQRYIQHLPKAGEIVFFDRSWYNRAIVEPVNGFCSEEEYKTFMKQVNDFEKMLIDSGTYIIKFYFSISKDEQERRFIDLRENPLKKWKLTEVDEKAQDLWDAYTQYKKKMYKKTNTKLSPWIVIKANRKTKARIEAIRYVLNTIPYDFKDEGLLS